MSAFGVPEYLPHQVKPFEGNNVVSMTTTGDDRRLHVEFFVKQVYMEAQSEKEGRPIYQSENMVLIEAPGAKSNIIKKVQMEDNADCPSHPHRFPRQWQAFQNQQAQVPDGTPLEMCKFIAPHRVLELKGCRVHTAEQLAEMPESALQNLGLGARRERDLCKAFLAEDVKVNALSEALARESALKADMDMMRQQMAELSASVAGRLHNEGRVSAASVERAQEVVTKRRGRPKKEESNDH